MLNVLYCRYIKEGFCKGEIIIFLFNFIRLEWDLFKFVSVWIVIYVVEGERICS